MTTTDLQSVKQRFGIIGNDPGLNRAIEKAIRVSPTDISVLVTGESGVGKETIPKIIHQLSHRKHAKYIAVNCGAIPEGTIDSELFGHEKGAFTGATQARRGYFEEANGGTIFLDEVGELPLTTQVRLLRVLENGEFIKVGSSDVQKTDVRIVAATNLNMAVALEKEKFREDLFYRLSTIDIHLPALRHRQGDIHLLFRKFAADFAAKYKMPPIALSEDAIQMLLSYPWAGNIRQLRNIAEQISVVERLRLITGTMLKSYLPKTSNLPMVMTHEKNETDFSSEREILYKVLFDMKSDLNDLKKLTSELMRHNDSKEVEKTHPELIRKIYGEKDNGKGDTPLLALENKRPQTSIDSVENHLEEYDFVETIEPEETLSLHDKELELIKKSLERHKGKRKLAASELGISERTLYRKIKQFDL